jgi:hypothetical protein
MLLSKSDFISLRQDLESLVLNFYSLENLPDDMENQELFIECAQQAIKSLQTSVSKLNS